MTKIYGKLASTTLGTAPRSAPCSLTPFAPPPASLRASLLGCLLAATSAAPAAHAVSGFTGAFIPAYWSNQATYNGTNNAVSTSCDSLEWMFDYPLYYACFDFVNTENGQAQLGATKFEAATTTTATTNTLTWTNNSNFAYFVSFSVNLFWSEDPLTGPATATVSTYNAATSNQPTILASLTENSNSATIPETTMAKINPNWTLDFKVTAPIDQIGYVTLQINNFNAVPAPLPAAGAATVFAFSRRLRGRCRTEGNASRRPSPPRRAPSAYLSDALHLPDHALGQIPVSFEYAAMASPHSPADRAGSCRTTDTV